MTESSGPDAAPPNLVESMFVVLDHDAVPVTRSSGSSDVLAWSVAAASLIATMLIPVAAASVPTSFLELGMLLVAAVASAGLLARSLGLHRSGARRPMRLDPGVPEGRTSLRSFVDLALHLWPVALLTVVYPVAAQRMAGTNVGGTDLTSLLLAVSLTVPWLSQGVCLPLYRAVGPLVGGGDAEALRRRFCEAWPSSILLSVPTIALFALPVQLLTGWSAGAMLAYAASCVLHLVFAQSLVLMNLDRARVTWALVWTGYALPLVLAPTLWYLPPLLGLLPQLLVLRRFLVVRPSNVDVREVMNDLVRGLLLGSVLWADKLCFFLVAGTALPVETVFLALLPAVLAYNYYFIRLAPRFDAAVSALRDAMEHRSFEQLSRSSAELFAEVKRSVAHVGCLGAVLVLGLSWTIVGFRPAEALLVVAVAVASWLFMAITVVAYKMDYIGQRRSAQLWSGLHLAVCVAAFAALPAGPAVYLVLIGVESILLLGLLRACFQVWKTPEYTLFWRHATAW